MIWYKKIAHHIQIESTQAQLEIHYNIRAYTHQFVSLLFWKHCIPQSMGVSATFQQNNPLKETEVSYPS